MILTSRAKVIPLDRISNEPVGGKAAQLAHLARSGLRVPEGFVIVGAAPGNLPAELDDYSSRFSGAVAVRSSALGEDSAEASFAGQFDTVLGVQGVPAIRAAVERCLASTAGERAAAYRGAMHAEGGVRMGVVVQRMVDARAAGVLFTADPLTGLRDRIVINVVPGSGDALVGGYRTPDHFVLSREGEVLERALQGDTAIVEETRLEQLVRDALKAEAELGYPLDLEWAIDRDNQLYWLQARPITTLELPGSDELDDVIDPTWALTSHNVAELRYLRLVPGGRKRLGIFVARYNAFRIEPTADLVEYYGRLEHAVRIYDESGAVHVHTSMMAIALLNLFQRLLSKGGPPSAKSHAAVAVLLAGAKSSSSDAAQSSIGVADALERLGALIAARPSGAQRFARMAPDEALQWLRNPPSGDAGKAFESFLTTHGHRCIRELDFRERDWQEDPLPLVSSLQLIAMAPRATQTDWTHEAHEALGELSWGARGLIRWLLPKAHAAVVERERSKSFSVWIARQLKRGYVGFAQQLVTEGRLPDLDLVFFFTHEELGRLAQVLDRGLVRRAEHRRRLYPRKIALEFPRVCQGKPAPLGSAEEEGQGGDAMQGMPLSRGVAVGPARVAHTVAEAAAMQAGEILVTPFTDVGWTPYFSRAAGLATEVGSVLSHGAVVAREYGLPAVAGLPGVTRRFKTGDILRLDGNTGELRRVRTATS